MIKYIIQGYEYEFCPAGNIFYIYDEQDLENLVQQACEDYRDNHDGWESWKEGDVEVELFSEGKSIYKCKVSLCYEPYYEVWAGEKQ